ncbi:leader peptidase (prepilin peptidase) / N-methyltransferase [Tissierella praeacuta DSM 18095]|uniref:Leader peptidase (Prepilin peptidase) / N-methyltransferase n=1 Tax=Tissierella praeacuta DSM 18095 TaxID=1123404 RepID=A0A1M4XIB6_9FIRM|nr:A24 family peptidase [Tissierella praeacuta]TCU67833.1 leader peptidase (prepilin peptidase)/N-methyltransferase [Tissierella praeacuta]SHE93304.1 leader peptidase (prepilin peptidase) / N-methyltransferase [Tissierella praeacuta DSM 18095]SUP02088.1 Flp pilus assembly protein, protease CpaA [Tissierella praeacuta]
MKSIMLVLLGAIGFVTGYNISTAVDKMILWKEKQNNKKYILYHVECKLDNWINGILVSLGMTLAFNYFVFYKFIFTSMMCIIAVFGARIDEKIRIIPNELVLVILVLGIINRLVTGGVKSLGGGFLALTITAGIFFLSAFITRLLSGSIGIGAGDIKLAMVLSLMLGFENVYLFLVGIVLFLTLYIITGFSIKTMWIGSAFPMCTQIMGGCIMAMYEPIITRVAEGLFKFIG